MFISTSNAEDLFDENQVLHDTRCMSEYPLHTLQVGNISVSAQITGHKSRSIHMIPSVISRHSIQQTFVFPIPPNFHAAEQWAGHYQPIDQVLCISSTRSIQPWATSHNELSKHLKSLKASSPPVSNYSSPSCTNYKKIHINVLDQRYPTTWRLILLLLLLLHSM